MCRAVVESFSRQAADDLVRFLECRADEMAPGGRLLIAVPAQRTILDRSGRL